MIIPSFPASGFYAILDSGYVSSERWAEKAESLLSGGAAVLQVRAKQLSIEETRQRLEAVVPICAKYDVPLILNDHLELALDFPHIGLHLGQDDGDIRAARERLGPGRPLGLSTHSIDQARLAVGLANVLTYFAVGPVYATGTKPDYPPVGVDLVKQVAALKPPLPFFCIGGINLQNTPEVLAAGATGVVAVSAPLLSHDTEAATAAFVRLLSGEAGS